MPTRDRDDDDGAALGSGDFGSTRVAPILLSRTPSRLSTLGAVRLLGHQAAAVAEGEAKVPGMSGVRAGFIAEHHAPNGV